MTMPARVKPKKPALYTGKTSWLDYLIHFEMISDINNWSPAAATNVVFLWLNLRKKHYNTDI